MKSGLQCSRTRWDRKWFRGCCASSCMLCDLGHGESPASAVCVGLVARIDYAHGVN